MAARSPRSPTSPNPALRRAQATIRHHDQSDGRGRRGSAVTFDAITSVYPFDDFSDPQVQDTGTLGEEEEEEEDPGNSGRYYTCSTLLERRSVRRFFRLCAVLNLLSLAFSAPLRVCTDTPEDINCTTAQDPPGEDCDGVFAQFVTIAVVDFIVAVLYTFQLVLRLMYTVFLCRHTDHKKKQSNDFALFEAEQTSERDGIGRDILRLLGLVIIFLSLWYSVGIGIYRSYLVSGCERRLLEWYFYVPLIPRSFLAFSAMKLFVYLRIPSSTLNNLLKKISNRWRQLFFVAVFYFFFIYIFALAGIQWIGSLGHRCYLEMDDGSLQLSIPSTHCTLADNSTVLHSCYNDTRMKCLPDNSTSSVESYVYFRNTVYLGQFRFILDALLAVYEASSWELWSFMSYNAFNGAPRMLFFPGIFYFAMVLFLVVIVQQSIFLVVIIESFADLRSDEALESSNKNKDKPTIVLYEQKGGNSGIGFKHIKTQESITAFKKKLKKYYYCVVEKVFIVLVLVDAGVTCTKHTGMSTLHADILYYWQIVVSVLFVLEVVGLFMFHLLSMPMQLLLFVKNPYFWYLLVIAVGGLLGSVELGSFSNPNPLYPGHFLAVFQALRLLRALRLVPQMRKFFSTFIGDGVRLVIVVLLVVVFLVLFAVLSMQLFGYLDPQPGCEPTDYFRDFIYSFQSMFQLLMQEGWTQMFSEIMCRRDWVYFFINIYFIMLHLLASLILLNFFVAVILDNLDYDEEVKKKKLEEAEKNTEKVQKVPYHLRIFELCGPKKIPVPKLSSTDAPNLTEADVRNFYNIGEASEFPTGFVAEQPLIMPAAEAASSGGRRTSELSQLDLLTGNAAEPAVSGGVSAHQGKYWGIQGILSYIQAYREHSRENEVNRPRQGPPGGEFLGTRGQVDSATPLVSEYEEYQQKYRLFDTALFLFPPGHWLRRSCKAILTQQMSEPSTNPLKDTEGKGFARTVLHTVVYLLRFLISFFSYFTWLMIFVTLAALGAQIREVHVFERTREYAAYIWWMDLIFVLFTSCELILKILAYGLFFNPHAAIQTVWDAIDWLIVLDTLAVMIVYLSSCGPQTELSVSYRNIPIWMLLLLTLRALRPLRLISLVPKMRHVIYDVLLGWGKFLMAGVLLVSFTFMFASLGVQLFAGEDSPEGFCNDPSMSNKTECVGEFFINVEVSLSESLPVRNGTDTFIFVPRVWYETRRNFRFDNTAQAFLTLFEVLTLEGWLDVRDLFGSGSDFLRQGSKYSLFMGIYIHIFVFLGVNFGLQLFVGIVVNNFNEHKPDHSALLTVSQKRWTDLVQRISLRRPIKKPPPPRDNKFRMFLYKVFISAYYKHFSTITICVSSILLWVPWVDETAELLQATRVLMSLSVVFVCLFLLEILLKLFAFGPKNYFQSYRNFFDFVLSLLGFVYIILAIVFLATSSGSSERSLINLNDIDDVALFFTLFRLCTILMRYGTLQNLLITVGSTIARSAALFGVLISVFLTYTFLGNLYFGNVRTGEAVEFGIVNFDGVLRAMTLLVRVVTGEDWHTIFRDSMVQEPYCSRELGTCGNIPAAVIFFLTYYVFVSFILLNVIIAVLLENFSIFYNEDDTELNHAVVRDFKLNWLYYDKSASGLISTDKLKLFLRMLKLKEFHTYVTFENGIKERQKCSLRTDSILLREMVEELRRDRKQLGTRQESVPGALAGTAGSQGQEDRGHNVRFQDVLKMLAYRAEDINQRLVPHELYIREELERSVQFDVAEQCILKWIKKFVKPVIKKQEKQRRQTLSHGPFRPRREDPLLWPPLLDSEGRDEHDAGDVDITPDESEDELDKDSVSGWRQPTLPRSRSEEEGATATLHTLDSDLDRLHDPHLVKSYMRLESAPFVHFKQQGAGGKDKWHEWFHMQKEWMNNVEENPDNYFDDNL